MASAAPRPSGRRSTAGDPKQEDDHPLSIRFTTVRKIFDLINGTPGLDFLIVTRVSPAQFTQIEGERDRRRRRFRFHRYESKSQILFIALPTALIETLHIEIYSGYYAQLVRKGIERTWRSMGCVTRRSQPSHPGGDVDTGEGDSTGGPELERGRGGAWATLVVLAGVSEPLDELRNDARWWFAASGHDVKIVVLAKFERARNLLTLEMWEEEVRPARPGATTTRSATAPQPLLRQTVTITEHRAAGRVWYNASGPLVLGFKSLFLRDPGQGEEDFVLDVEELERDAERVWRMIQ